jgi:3-oxoacyl-[acyl-carrier-protein] synthase II
MGHTMGSCGVIETIITLYMMEEGFVAPTLNLDKVDERCAMINLPMGLIESPIRIAAIQNFAFGGVNTCLMLRRFES